MSDESSKPRSATGASAAKKKKGLNPIVELIGLVAIALLLALGIQALLIKPYRIPSESMEPLLDVGQRVLVNRASHHLGADPKVGDVVVFHPPRGAGNDSPNATEQAECAVAGNIEAGQPCPKSVGGEWKKENYIKRVVGGPGDRISVKDGHVVRNGVEQKESFISDTCDGAGTTNTPCTLPRTITVPAGMYYMMGDNRGESNDSRYWGPVPRDWVIGGAFATYWPPKRIGGI